MGFKETLTFTREDGSGAFSVDVTPEEADRVNREDADGTTVVHDLSYHNERREIDRKQYPSVKFGGLEDE